MKVLIIPIVILTGWCVYALLPTLYYKFIYPKRYESKFKLQLTFDDGPDEYFTDRVLELLKAHQVRAIFFLVAEKAEKYPAVVERIILEGHEVGLHCHRHRKALFQTPMQTKRDIMEGIRVLNRLGIRPRFYRPPHGYIHLSMLRLLKRNGLTLLLWNILPHDWMGKGADEIFWAMLHRSSRGGVICLHDSGVGTGGDAEAPGTMIQALKKFIPFMEMNGYYFE